MGAWDQISHPGRRRPTALLVAVTVVATVAMPLLLVQAIELGARTSGQRQSALPMVGLLGLAVLVATWLVQRWMGARWGVMGASAGLWLFVLATAYLAIEQQQLEAVGHRAPAVVAERQSAVRADDHVCQLVRSSDRRPIEPALTGSDCYQLREGELVRVVYDPAGEVPPMEADRFDRGEGHQAAATVLAWLYAAMIPLAAVRGRVLLIRAEVARPMVPPPGAGSPGIPDATRSPTGPYAACGLRCRPRWRLPVFPVLATVVVVGAAVLLISMWPTYISQQEKPPERQYPERIVGVAAGSALALVPSGWVVVRLRRRRHKVRSGHRIPVTVYYGSDRGALAGQTAARQVQVSATQPTLLAVATDGAIWALIPEPGSYVTHTGRAPLPLSGSNPWIVPLQALADDPRTPFGRDALVPQEPLLGDRTNGPVAGALARLAGHPEATPRDGDPPLPNDPRLCGGPVPGELLLPATPVPAERSVPTYGPRVGLVLHRPSHAPVHAGIDRWSLHRLYFGSDPGECIGVYATHIALDAPEARGLHPAPRAVVWSRTMLTNIRRTGMALVMVALVMGGCANGTSDDGDDADADTRSTETTRTQDEGARDPAEDQAVEVDEAETPRGAMLLIMDASGSMNETDANGQPLIDGAKAALHGVVDALPDEVDVGLRVYGHRSPNTDRVNGCQDTELIAPVAPLDRNALDQAIDGYQALGFTPIGLSLQLALEDLPPEGPRGIVLVSDGEDTCAPPDPCQVAEQVRAEDVDLVIHTVGFALPDDASRQQLQCIAEAGGGTFTDAADATELADALEDVSTRETRRYETSGIPLEGVRIPRDANTGQPDTAYVDTVLGSETNFYRFEMEPGSEVRGEVIIVGDAGNEGRSVCPGVFLTDEDDKNYENAPFQGGDSTETYIKNTDPVVVDADEVWIKIELTNCLGEAGREAQQFHVELRLAIVD